MTRHDPTRAYRPRRAPTTVEDRDACALYAWLAKDARPTHEAIDDRPRGAREDAAPRRQRGRRGRRLRRPDVDIPREIWAEAVRAGGHAPSLALDPRFAVAHVFIPRGAGDVARAARSARARR